MIPPLRFLTIGIVKMAKLKKEEPIKALPLLSFRHTVIQGQRN